MRPELLEPFARTIVGALGAGILESALLAFVILGLTKVRPRPSATTRHVFWWSALAASVALPLVSIAFSFGHVEHRRVVEAPPRTAAAAWRQLPPQRTQEARPQGRRPSDAAALSSPIRISGSRIVETPAIRDDSAVSSLGAADFSRAAAALVEARAVASRAVSAIDSGFTGLALVAVWLNVVIFGLFSLGRSFRTLRALKRNASPLDEQLLRRLRRGRHASRLGRSVALAVSNEIDVPVAVGFRNPTILMPIGVVEREAAADIDQIAMHEYAHLERYDDWTNLAQRALERVFWFNPIVTFIGRCISLEREIACDDWVVAQTGQAHRYATCLWRLVESSRLPAKPTLAPGALQSPKQITVRIEQLLDSRRNSPPRLSPLGALAVGALCIALVVIQAQRAPVIALTEKVVPAPAVPAVTAQHPATARRTLPVHNVTGNVTLSEATAGSGVEGPTALRRVTSPTIAAPSKPTRIASKAVT